MRLLNVCFERNEYFTVKVRVEPSRDDFVIIETCLKSSMGKLFYGAQSFEIEFDDRTLLHLEIVIANKLRLGESFMFTWKNDVAVGNGRSTVWLDRSIPLHFKFYGSKLPSINPKWITALSDSANSGTGLLLSAEPESA